MFQVRIHAGAARAWSPSPRSCPNMMTGHPGIFAGGDMVPAERTVTVGVGHGKKAARHVDAWLRGTEYSRPLRPELATFDKLNSGAIVMQSERI